MKLTKKQMLIRKAPATALNQTSATDEDSCRKTTSKIDPVPERSDGLSLQVEPQVAA